MRAGFAALNKNEPNYQKALNKFNAARECDPTKAKAVEDAINKVFDAIERQKDKEKSSRQRADQNLQKTEEALREMKRQLKIAEDSYAAQQKAHEEAKQKRAIAKTEQQKADSLAERGKLLQRTLTQEDASLSFAQLNALGHQFFAYDSVSLSRDYQQAGVYFSLAQFVQPDSKATIMARCAKNGQNADRLFFVGEIDAAQSLYAQIVSDLSNLAENSAYERKQIERIADINALIRTQKITTERGDTLVLDGNWWTIPPALFESQNPRFIVLRNNSALTDGLPSSLLQQSGIETLSIENCPRLTEIKDWGKIAERLVALSIKACPVLRTLELSDGMSALKQLQIRSNPELIRIQAGGLLPALAEVALLDNPLLTQVNIWAQSTTMETLFVKGNPKMSSKELVLDRMPLLSNLTLSDLSDLETLRGAGRHPQLRQIGLFNNPNLRNIQKFDHLPLLNNLIIASNPRLKTLGSLRNLPSLEKINVDNNENLRSLIQWKRADKLQQVQVSNNSRLRRLGNWQALKDVPQIKLPGNDFLKKYATLRVGILGDGLSDNFFETVFTAGFSYNTESSGRWWAIMPAVDYILFKGTNTNDLSKYLPFYRAAKTTTNAITGVQTETVRYFDGGSKYDLRFLDFKLLGKLKTPSDIIDIYLLLGPTLMWRMPDREVSAYITDAGTVFSKKTESRVVPYFFVGVGFSKNIKRFKPFLELHLQTPFGGNNISKNTIRQTLYSATTVKFDTNPLPNAFEIDYKQTTFDIFIGLNIGVSYQLNYFNPHIK
jgi:tetratricopeptide (TPR) repeat protein